MSRNPGDFIGDYMIDEPIDQVEEEGDDCPCDDCVEPPWHAQYMENVPQFAKNAAETIDKLMLDSLGTATALEYVASHCHLRAAKLPLREDSEPEDPIELYRLDGSIVPSVPMRLYAVERALSTYARQFHIPAQEGEDIIAWFSRVEDRMWFRDGMTGEQRRQCAPFLELMRAMVAATTGITPDELDELIDKMRKGAPGSCRACGGTSKHFLGCPSAPRSISGSIGSTMNPLQPAPSPGSCARCGGTTSHALTCPARPGYGQLSDPFANHNPGCPGCPACNTKPAAPRVHSFVPTISDPLGTRCLCGDPSCQKGMGMLNGRIIDDLPKDSLLNPKPKGFQGSSSLPFDSDYD